MECGGGQSGFDHGVHAHTGIHHEVVEAAVVPFALVVAADVLGAAAVGGEDLAFGVRGMVGEDLLDEADAAGHGGIDEDVEGSGGACEDGGGSATDDDAASFGGFLFEVVANEFDHALAVEDIGVAGKAFKGAGPDGLAEAMEPGVDVFVAALDDVGVDAGFLSDLVDDGVVDEPPAKAVGQVLGKGGSLAAIFAFDGNELNHDVFSFACEAILAFFLGRVKGERPVRADGVPGSVGGGARARGHYEPEGWAECKNRN